MLQTLKNQKKKSTFSDFVNANARHTLHRKTVSHDRRKKLLPSGNSGGRKTGIVATFKSVLAKGYYFSRSLLKEKNFKREKEKAK